MTSLRRSYSREICKKSFSASSNLARHKRIYENHLNHKEDNDCSSHKINFVDCGEEIKLEDIKEEINEEESVDDPLSIQGDTTESESQNIVAELKEEVIYGDTLLVQEIHNSGDEENNTVVDDIDIVQHKIEIDN